MVCGKTNENEPLKEFILQSPAPIDTAVKLSSLYREMSEKEKVSNFKSDFNYVFGSYCRVERQATCFWLRGVNIIEKSGRCRKSTCTLLSFVVPSPNDSKISNHTNRSV